MVLKKLRTETPPDDPAIPLMGMYPEETRHPRSTLFTAALSTSAKTETTVVSTEG